MRDENGGETGPGTGAGFAPLLPARLTLRDHFAAAALTGLLAWSPDGVGAGGQYDPEAAAEKAYEVADAMLTRRNDS